MRSDSERIYFLDLARGFCLVLMTIDHLPENIFGRFSNVRFGPFGFFTAASAFVFISGIVSAKTYGSTYSNFGAWTSCLRVSKRIAQIYAVNLAMFLLLLVCAWTGFLKGNPFGDEYDLLFSNPLRALLRGVFLLYRPGYLDILPMYVVFLLCVVPLLAAVRAGWRWFALAVSVLVWFFAQRSDGSTALNPFGYQILFVIGLIIGSSWDEFSQRSRRTMRVLGWIVSSLAVTMLLARFATGLLRIAPDVPAWSALTDLENNGPLRLLNFMWFVVLATHVWVRLPEWIQKDNAVARWISTLGRHSLPVFAWSILATHLSIVVMGHQPGKPWALVDMLLTLSTLAIPALFGERWRSARLNRRRDDWSSRLSLQR